LRVINNAEKFRSGYIILLPTRKSKSKYGVNESFVKKIKKR
jgi:hypothetical protein